MDENKRIFPSIGRLKRLDYVLWQVLLSLFYLVFIGLELPFGMLGFLTIKHILILKIVFMVFEVYITARRLQDCNFSGWFSLLLLIHVITVPEILFMCIYPGTKGENKYDADPLRK